MLNIMETILSGLSADSTELNSEVCWKVIDKINIRAMLLQSFKALG